MATPRLTRTLIPLLALLTLAVFSGHAQFEGIVETANVSTDEYGKTLSFTMTMWISPVGVRIGIPATESAPGVIIIGRTDRPVRWVLNEKEKSYFELPVEMPPEEEKPPSAPAAFHRTGKRKKILGYRAEQILIRNGELMTEIWATSELKSLVETLDKALGSRDVEGGEPWNAELAREGLFPLRAQTREGKTVLESSDVTKIHRVRVNPTLMDVPPEYRRQGVRDVIREETAPDPQRP